MRWSGRRDLNSRPPRWQRDALPAELLPHGAPGGTRTLTPVRATDFKSVVSTYSTTRACEKYLNFKELIYVNIIYCRREVYTNCGNPPRRKLIRCYLLRAWLYSRCKLSCARYARYAGVSRLASRGPCSVSSAVPWVKSAATRSGKSL